LVIFDQTITVTGEALALHVKGMVKDGQALPAPTPLDKIEPDVDMHAIILIGAHRPARKMRINVMMDVALLAEIDCVATNRSLFLSKAAWDALKAGLGCIFRGNLRAKRMTAPNKRPQPRNSAPPVQASQGHK
jgi:hypothetical protein